MLRLNKGESAMMKNRVRELVGRRSFLGSAASVAAGALGATFWSEKTLEAALQNTRTASKPSDLKITDLRMAQVGRRGLIRIDTNQGIYGLGENRDGASNVFPLMLKRLVLDENPCNVDKIFRKIKQFGGPARQGGGVSGIEVALWDLAGKAYNVPIYQMLGGKFRDRIRCYSDTSPSNDPQVFGQQMKTRMSEGFTFLKMDLRPALIEKIPGTMTYPSGADISGSTVHMFTGLEYTDKGIAIMADFLAKLREIVGMEIPIATDHFGHIGVNTAIRMGKAFERFNLAWMEDFIPWQYTELWKKITDSIDVPTLTGEDIFLKEPFEVLCREHAVDMIQPDLLTSGGILETKKIGDMAQEYGVPMVLHMAESPIACFAAVHCAAATENFLVLENHDVDNPSWGDIVDGVEKPIINKGYIKVPDGPGLGITLNEEALKKQLSEPGYFEPTPGWDPPKQRVNDRLWSQLWR
jgi:L-alanine-DL-glutamate epimerase-like enolase superfamily enzyme